jgi:hypothetical protein
LQKGEHGAKTAYRGSVGFMHTSWGVLGGRAGKGMRGRPPVCCAVQAVVPVHERLKTTI